MNVENSVFLENLRLRIIAGGADAVTPDEMHKALSILNEEAGEAMAQAFSRKPQITSPKGKKGIPAALSLDAIDDLLSGI